MSSKWNSRFKSNRVQHDYRKKRIQNFENRNVNLMVENVIQIKSGILMRVQKTSYMRKRLY